MKLQNTSALKNLYINVPTWTWYDMVTVFPYDLMLKSVRIAP
jgi:hypothetical protein